MAGQFDRSLISKIRRALENAVLQQSMSSNNSFDGSETSAEPVVIHTAIARPTKPQLSRSGTKFEIVLPLILSRLGGKDALNVARSSKRCLEVFRSDTHWQLRLLRKRNSAAASAGGSAANTTNSSNSNNSNNSNNNSSSESTPPKWELSGSVRPAMGDSWLDMYRQLLNTRINILGARLKTESWERTVGHPAGIGCAAAHGNRLVTAGPTDAICLVWDITLGSVVRKIRTEGPIVALHVDDRNIFLCTEDGALRVWNIATGKGGSSFFAHKSRVNAVRILAPGLYISASSDRSLILYKGDTLDQAAVLTGHTEAVNCVVGMGDDFAVSGSDDKTIRVWDISTASAPKCIHVLLGHTDAVTALAVRGNHVASCSSDRTVRVWAVAAENRSVCLNVIPCPSVPLSIWLDSGLLIVGFQNGTVNMYIRDTYEAIHSVPFFSKRAVFVHLNKQLKLITTTDAEKNHIKVTTFTAQKPARASGSTLALALEAAKRFADASSQQNSGRSVKTGRVSFSKSTSSTDIKALGAAGPGEPAASAADPPGNDAANGDAKESSTTTGKGMRKSISFHSLVHAAMNQNQQQNQEKAPQTAGFAASTASSSSRATSATASRRRGETIASSSPSKQQQSSSSNATATGSSPSSSSRTSPPPTRRVTVSIQPHPPTQSRPPTSRAADEKRNSIRKSQSMGNLAKVVIEVAASAKPPLAPPSSSGAAPAAAEASNAPPSTTTDSGATAGGAGSDDVAAGETGMKKSPSVPASMALHLVREAQEAERSRDARIFAALRSSFTRPAPAPPSAIHVSIDHVSGTSSAPAAATPAAAVAAGPATDPGKPAPRALGSATGQRASSGGTSRSLHNLLERAQTLLQTPETAGAPSDTPKLLPPISGSQSLTGRGPSPTPAAAAASVPPAVGPISTSAPASASASGHAPVMPVNPYANTAGAGSVGWGKMPLPRSLTVSAIPTGKPPMPATSINATGAGGKPPAFLTRDKRSLSDEVITRFNKIPVPQPALPVRPVLPQSRSDSGSLQSRADSNSREFVKLQLPDHIRDKIDKGRIPPKSPAATKAQSVMVGDLRVASGVQETLSPTVRSLDLHSSAPQHADVKLLHAPPPYPGVTAVRVLPGMAAAAK